ncbi:DNA-binding response regulator [bacterium 1xD8-48]|nr:response regulator transcription factor [Lachnospiraceae bacterium]MCI9326615.1 response regulator transcription factor [Lachnospiraceae bacterium]NBJ96191.1 DNA-binding response regulator [bacterium 1xD8-48]
MLLVEDDAGIREVIEDYFSSRKSIPGAGNKQEEDEITVISAGDGEEGLALIAEGGFDIVILDIMLPGMDGFSLCRKLRKDSAVPVIFLTARGQEEDRLKGYLLGCDDYVVKPFSLAVLYARVRALVKRAKGMVLENVMELGGVRLLPDRGIAYAGGEELALTPKEFALLRYLLENRGRTISRERILISVWGYDFEGSDRVVDNHIRKLRKKLGKYGKQIKTVIKKGYRMDGE